MIKMRGISFEFDEGPWEVDVDVDKNDGSHRIFVNTAAEAPICGGICRLTPVIEGSKSRWSEEDMDYTESRLANARLIAAAPEMLALLLDEASETGGSDWDKKIWALVDKIQPNKLTAKRTTDKTDFM